MGGLNKSILNLGVQMFIFLLLIFFSLRCFVLELNFFLREHLLRNENLKKINVAYKPEICMIVHLGL